MKDAYINGRRFTMGPCTKAKTTTNTVCATQPLQHSTSPRTPAEGSQGPVGLIDGHWQAVDAANWTAVKDAIILNVAGATRGASQDGLAPQGGRGSVNH